MADQEVTFRILTTTFTDLLTVAIHLILYTREIYPRTSFLLARRYNLPVRQNRHPKVCEWINDAVAAVEAELLKGAVDRVVVVIYTGENEPVERYVFDTSRFPKVPLPDVDTPLVRTESDGERAVILPRVDLEEQFRGTLARLGAAAERLQALPNGCTFTVAIELSEEGEAPIRHPQAWIPAQPNLVDHDDATVKSQGNVTVPVRAVSAGEMKFEAWIEEARETFDDG